MGCSTYLLKFFECNFLDLILPQRDEFLPTSERARFQMRDIQEERQGKAAESES